MVARAAVPKEVVAYRGSEALPGIEVIDVQHSPREWRLIPDNYGVVVFKSWRGQACTRGQAHVGEAGLAFCTMPGETVVGTPKAGPGSFNVIELHPELLEQWLSEQQPGSVRPDWAAVMQPMSSALRRRFAEFFAVLEPGSSAMQMQSRLLELSELMLSELVRGARQPHLPAGPPIRGAARMRECLNEEGLNIDLDTLARRAGLSRFQALRAFRQRYGLPPHAYQLCLRISHARGLLRDGLSAADVAVRCGFADQSHFTRHFKRINAITPMQYARTRASSSELDSATFRLARDLGAVLSRSDR
jgi:AraC-like DNA-binding protein